VKKFIGLIVVILLLFGAFTWFTLTWSYAEGERAGYIQKFSRKGWVCKTWEGEIALVTMPGTVAEKFAFTVWDDAVAAQINADVAQRVALSYKQHKWIPTSCFGDTEYFVYKVRVTESPAPLAPAPQAPAPKAPAPEATAPQAR
jgi:hypothetical protein